MELHEKYNNIDLTVLTVGCIVDDVSILIKRGYSQTAVSLCYNYIINNGGSIRWAGVDSFFLKFTFPVPKAKKDFSQLLTDYINQNIKKN